MPSIIPDYEYDIFISYRQKDNKYDGWVSLFVENLKKELEATFKEDVSIYFDINPLDGIIESHDVSDSLKDKLKCLIFIPIISQTYCDLKSFAWEHEFKKFIEIASNDKFGLKVKLLNGNTASRILPIKINDLKSEDINLFESVTGEALRGIEFIYKSLGVNRPLRSIEDHAQDNLNKTYYRDQINKTARVINDIITALNYKHSGIPVDKTGIKSISEMFKITSKKDIRNKRPIIIGILTIAFLFLIIFSFLRLHNSNNLSSEEILDRVINYYDYYHNWKDYNGKIHLITLFVDGRFSEEILEIKTKENYYKASRFDGKDSIVQGIKDGKCFKEKNGINNLNGLDSLGIRTFKDHHYWLFGGVMYLKSNGFELDKNVFRSKFQGYDCLTLTFKCDTNKIKSHYFNSSIWQIYINHENYSIVGYQSKGIFENKIDQYAVYQGETESNGIKMPLIRIYHNCQDNSIFLIDMFHKIE